MGRPMERGEGGRFLQTKVGHGTYTQYAIIGCRCDECREYQRCRVARNRLERLTRGIVNHGVRSSYDAGCRCDACKAARSLASRYETVQRRALRW